jgi:hypothetical protein
MTVYGIVANIGLGSDKPFGVRRIAVIQDLGPPGLPIDQLGLFGPEGLGFLDGTAVKLGILVVRWHGFVPWFSQHACRSPVAMRPLSVFTDCFYRWPDLFSDHNEGEHTRQINTFCRLISNIEK